MTRSKRKRAPEQLELLKKRPFLHSRYPVHVTLRAIAAVGKLRNGRAYRAIREATMTMTMTMTMTERDEFRIVHLSIQHNHIHLLVEAKHKEALAVGMKGSQISAAKHLNAAISKGKPGPRRRGTVFPARYHATIITTPTQARHALAYVLNNFRKHKEDLTGPASEWKIDWFSSATSFLGWAEDGDSPWLWSWPATYDPLITYQPKTWLLAKGWKLSQCSSISAFEVPGRRSSSGI